MSEAPQDVLLPDVKLRAVQTATILIERQKMMRPILALLAQEHESVDRFADFELVTVTHNLAVDSFEVLLQKRLTPWPAPGQKQPS